MTDTQWQFCDAPQSMIEFLDGRRSDRKLRLFACACQRVGWHLISDLRSKEFVSVLEDFVDGFASVQQCQDALNGASAAVGDLYRTLLSSSSSDAMDQYYAAKSVEFLSLKAVDATRDALWLAPNKASQLLRDIFGKPFRPATIDPAWLAWNEGIVGHLARAIYEERERPSGHLDAGRLAILADALEDAGCADADILSHCRSPGPHVRGCWVVDLLLDKA